MKNTNENAQYKKVPKPQIQKIHLTHPFAPVFDTYSRVLILGSFPSVISRDEQFYYAHSHNRFWRILATLFAPEIDIRAQDRDAKKQFLLTHHIALWDIVCECDICNSSDSTLSNAKPNDISVILSSAKINAIFCNGRKAYELFIRFFGSQMCETQEIKVFLLPSSSPANARYSLEKLVDSWRVVLNYV
ncbi:DNA-deoxyinosine glycosylase [Helicobacter sp. MIT 03-1614]|uniref:DNA-deoxyinosine glycosylase n=1 Tax=Helicobacter sp. MIT 03-1614 TaxID=1548147 RepID=UPI000691A746|nr:DNA-deoxyinosine glycosylase [Helicobacter sp. MIT 03-1614]TLD87449.1 DNA-deoxyinosine glycosylase [Helicobacter sp. MIT 03-1614]